MQHVGLNLLTANCNKIGVECVVVDMKVLTRQREDLRGSFGSRGTKIDDGTWRAYEAHEVVLAQGKTSVKDVVLTLSLPLLLLLLLFAAPLAWLWGAIAAWADGLLVEWGTR